MFECGGDLVAAADVAVAAAVLAADRVDRLLHETECARALRAVAYNASEMNTVESSSAEALFGISGSGTLNTPISHRTQGPPLATSSPSYGRTAATSTSTTAYLSFLLLTHLLHLCPIDRGSLAYQFAD
ncbi:hypothetical protein OUZ56_004590 [Daphnia magna]|uniref:Uncharacterized protein n=1 Tax=Daphnia magna TaxID=35525 RepID=A0ABQ9YQ85_9CRUS|nr:hypothetical protein OUZ56_004590 [Daphnia magna]